MHLGGLSHDNEDRSNIYRGGFGNPRQDSSTNQPGDLINAKISIWKDWRKFLKMESLEDTKFHRDLEDLDEQIQSFKDIEEEVVEALGLDSSTRNDPVQVRDACAKKLRGLPHGKKERKMWARHLGDLEQLAELRKKMVRALEVVPDKYIGDHILALYANERLETQPKTTNSRNLWALLIGINQYPGNELGGAVEDIRNIGCHLVQNGVPIDHICTLVNGSATRAGILTALRIYLLDNELVKRGDPILVYFSGHGSSYSIAASGRERYNVEALCPVDRGDEVRDITDRELYFFLTRLHDKKGNNITLILDCCHSGGIPRAPEGNPLVRSLDPLLNISSIKDVASNVDHLRAYLGGDVPMLDVGTNWVADMSIAVVLAACQPYEKAWERVSPRSGWFTSALIKNLKSASSTITYRELVKKIGSLPSNDYPRQTPLAFGTRIDRPIFS